MLIPSERHFADDKKLWDELEEADCIHSRNILPQTSASMTAIRAFLADGPAYVGVSWGKDSVAVAHLVGLADPSIPLLNLRCTNRNPDCDAVRDKYLEMFPRTIYEEIFVDYGNLHAQNLTHQTLDKLTDERWNAAIKKSGRKFGHRHILGIRADESSGRRARCCRWGENSPNGCAPLAWWNLTDVFGYLALNNLPTHPAYAMLGGGRWPRERLRTAEIGDTHGTGGGRAEWEREYYGDVLNKLATETIFP